MKTLTPKCIIISILGSVSEIATIFMPGCVSEPNTFVCAERVGMAVQHAPHTLAERILSKGISDAFGSFFTDVLGIAREFQRDDITRPVFIAVITRRCFVMFFSYYEMLCWCIDHAEAERPKPWEKYTLEALKEFAEVFRNCIITDNAAWAMAYDMVLQYKETGVFPQIIAVDELLFHGRALNRFLFGLEKRLLHAKSLYNIKSPATMTDADWIRSVFLNHLTIRVANRYIGKSVLLRRYQLNLIENNPGTELAIEAWRNCSIAYAQYVSICGVNNTGFTLGAAIPISQDSPPSLQDGRFAKVSTKLQNIEQDTWLYFYPSAENPRLVCTVRRKQSQTDETKNMYVPYLILDHLSPEQLRKVHRKLVQEALAQSKLKIAALLGQMDAVLSEEKADQFELLVPWLSQTADLVLTSWLMKRFLREVRGASEDAIQSVWKDAINWGQLAANFRRFPSANTAQDETLNALTELWSWEPANSLEAYFDVYIADAAPIKVDWMDCRRANSETELGENSALVQCLEDTVAQVGLEAERNAYTLYGSGVFFSDETLSSWGDNHSLDTLLEKLHLQTEIYTDVLDGVNLYEAAAIIVQAMDLGLLGMNTVLDKQPCEDRVRYAEKPRELYTRQRAGEAALFLLPIRYRNLLPVLSEIQAKRQTNFGSAKYDIACFVNSVIAKEPAPVISITNDICMRSKQLERSLCSAYEMLVQGGQQIKEWQCNLHDRRLPNKQQKEVEATNQDLKIRFLQAYRDL